MIMKPKLTVFASGTKEGGGSGFENLVEATRSGILDAEIGAVVSNHEKGGVRQRAERLGVPFIHMPGPFGSGEYQKVMKESGGNWAALSGWLKLVHGLDPQKTFNIHPALLSYDHGCFGGPGLYGRHVQEAVKKALDAGEISESGPTMHFVTDEYDRGPIFFEYRVPISKGRSAAEISEEVHAAEHEWQPIVTNMVIHGEISWDGHDPASLRVPAGYEYLPKS